MTLGPVFPWRVFSQVGRGFGRCVEPLWHQRLSRAFERLSALTDIKEADRAACLLAFEFYRNTPCLSCLVSQLDFPLSALEV